MRFRQQVVPGIKGINGWEVILLDRKRGLNIFLTGTCCACEKNFFNRPDSHGPEHFIGKERCIHNVTQMGYLPNEEIG